MFAIWALVRPLLQVPVADVRREGRRFGARHVAHRALVVVDMRADVVAQQALTGELFVTLGTLVVLHCNKTHTFTVRET